MTKALNPPLPILLVDDEASWLRSLAVTLKSAGGYNHLLSCQNSQEVMATLARQPVSLILLDLMLPHLSGEELLSAIVAQHPQIPVIILSGMNQLETAVRCIKIGAFDYFVKTSEKERLLAGVHRALSFAELLQENARLKEQVLQARLHRPEAFADIITASRKMRSVFRYVEAVAASKEPILITGESGVGKEPVARAVHRLGTPGRPWMAVNVGGLDDHVFADTLFGHCKGAYTGADKARAGAIETAQDGTLFLDEIGDLSQISQVKLLRLLQEREYFPLGSDMPKKARARIVCATNHDLEGKIAAGEFRKDLYFRLCTHQVHIPPLRERREDIPVLLEHFLAEAAESIGGTKPAVPEWVLELLAGYGFPGNVRELRSMAYEAATLSRGGRLSEKPFRKAASGRTAMTVPASRPAAALPGLLSPPADHLPTLEEAGHLLVAEAMSRADNNRTLAAKWLGISRQGLSKRLKKLPR